LVKELPYLGMPLMHLLQRIDAAAPGYLDAVIREGPGVFDEFCIQCAAFLKQKRAEIPDQIILSKESRGVVALHYEISFSPEPATDIFSLVGAQKPHIVKGGILPNGAAGFDAGETASYQTSSARQEYLKEVDALRSSEPKEKYLRLLKEATADPDTLCLVWHLMHGGPEHSWFYHGTPGTQRAPDQMRHPHAVSYVELAEALFTAQVERDQKGETLSFGHVTVILDACQQYTMAEGTLRELDRLALRAGRTIKSFPTIVALSQPLMYGFMNVAVVERSSNPGVDKRSAIEVADALVSPLFSPLVLKARETGELTVGDLIAAEVKAVDSFQLLLQDSKRLSVTADSSVITGSEVDAKGRRLLNAQDPSVFGSAPCSLLEVLEYVRSQSLREGITIPAFQNRETLARPSYLEISMRGAQAHSCSYS